MAFGISSPLILLTKSLPSEVNRAEIGNGLAEPPPDKKGIFPAARPHRFGRGGAKKRSREQRSSDSSARRWETRQPDSEKPRRGSTRCFHPTVPDSSWDRSGLRLAGRDRHG